MSMIPEVQCRRCGQSFSALRTRCPNCGTRRVMQSGRTPAPTPGTVKGTASYDRAETNTRWQLIFGLILVVAVILAVIVMVSTTLNGLDNENTPSRRSRSTPTPAVVTEDPALYIETAPTFHKIVRGASRRADIAYEAPDGKVVYDDIEDPLPFDINAPVIEIHDEDFALWYRDMSEEPKKYEGKTVRFKCRALVRSKLPKETFVVGRHVMTCCAEDIQFAGLVCQWTKADSVEDESWMILTARISFKFNRAYGKRGPVLSYIAGERCEPPAQAIATFY